MAGIGDVTNDDCFEVSSSVFLCLFISKSPKRLEVVSDAADLHSKAKYNTVCFTRCNILDKMPKVAKTV